MRDRGELDRTLEVRSLLGLEIRMLFTHFGQVVLAGHSYGGLLALSLAARYPSAYKNLVLVDPIADLLSIRHVAGGRLVQSLLGQNFTEGAVLKSGDVRILWER